LPAVVDPGTSSSSTAMCCTVRTQTKVHAIATVVRGPLLQARAMSRGTTKPLAGG
jgi:hypothetical protein